MATPTPLAAHELRVDIYVTDAFVYLCTAEQTAFQRDMAFEEKMVRDCSSPGSIPTRISQPSGKSWTLTINDQFDPDSTALQAIRTAFEAGTAVEVKITEVRASTGKTYTGDARVESLAASAGMTGFASLAITMRGDGAYTIGTYTA